MRDEFPEAAISISQTEAARPLTQISATETHPTLIYIIAEYNLKQNKTTSHPDPAAGDESSDVTNLGGIEAPVFMVPTFSSLAASDNHWRRQLSSWQISVFSV